MTAERPQEWHDERRSYIGASQMAIALGLAPSGWGDPISLWEEKLGIGVPKEQSFRMKLGQLAEPIIGTLASEALDRKLNRVLQLQRHPEHPFLASNPDFRIVGDRGLVQAKLRLDGHPFGTPNDDGKGESIPLHYRVQGLGELLTTGLDFVYFALLEPFGGLSLHLLDRRADGVEAEIEDLKLDLVEWWQEYVEKEHMPGPSAGSSEALARRYAHRTPTKFGKIASAGQEETMQELLDVRAARAALEEQEEALKNRVKAMIGEAHYIEGVGRRFAWGETHRKTVGWKEVAAAYRRIIEGVARDHNVVDLRDLDTIEGLYTVETDARGPFTIAELK